MSTKDALQAIYDEHQTLTPALVVKEASDPAHELHDRFDWDDTSAAIRFREVQAAQLIRSVKIVVERPEPVPPLVVRAWVAEKELIPSLDAEDEQQPVVGEYRPMTEVLVNDVTRTAFYRRLEQDWRNLKARAGTCREFAAMVLDDVQGMLG